MKTEFSTHIKLKKPLLKKLIEELSTEFEYVSILATDVRGKRYEQDFSTSNISDIMIFERGYVCRVYNGTSYSEYSFDTFDESCYENVKQSIKKTAQKDIEFFKNINVPMTKYPLLDEQNIVQNKCFESESSAMPPQEVMNELTGLINKAKNYSELLVNASIRYEEAYISKAFYSTSKDLEQAYVFSTAMFISFVMREGRLKYAYDSRSAQSLAQSLNEIGQNYKKTIDTAIQMLDAEPVKPGEYDVICDPDVAGLIAHDA